MRNVWYKGVECVSKRSHSAICEEENWLWEVIYQALPFVSDSILEAVGHIVVNLMKDQIDRLTNLGILAVSLCEITKENAKGVVKGKISIVYGCPEAWLKNEHWIKVLSSQIYRLKLCAIAVDEAHVIKQW